MFERELIYFWYYFVVLVKQIAPYWVVGIVIGSFVSVFGKARINQLFISTRNQKFGLLGLLPASLLGIISPLCMYGTIPIAASFSEKGVRDDWLAAFMMSSILLNPQLIIYSSVLGKTVLLIRIASSIFFGIVAGLFIYFFYRKRQFFNFQGLTSCSNRDTDPNLFMRLLKNIWRNVKATGIYFLVGIVLTVLFQRYVPADSFAGLFGNNNRGFGVLFAATLGVSVYVCGGGTIPLLFEWLNRGLSYGAAAAFMISGPATKFTNLGALKIVLGAKRFFLYLAFVIIFASIFGLIINTVLTS